MGVLRRRPSSASLSGRCSSVQTDVHFSATRRHVASLMQRYGAPLLLLNLLREAEAPAERRGTASHEGQEDPVQTAAAAFSEEAALGEAYEQAVEALNQVRPASCAEKDADLVVGNAPSVAASVSLRASGGSGAAAASSSFFPLVGCRRAAQRRPARRVGRRAAGGPGNAAATALLRKRRVRRRRRASADGCWAGSSCFLQEARTGGLRCGFPRCAVSRRSTRFAFK